MAAIELLGRPVLGWKVARVRPELAAAWGADRITGPVFSLWDAADQPAVPVIGGGYSAAEAEFQLRVREIPDATALTVEQAAGSIDALRVGIEIAGSPYAGINAHGPAVTVSDFGNNIGLVLGPQTADGDGAFGRTVSSFLNGEPVGSGVAADGFAGPFEAARFLFALAARHGLPLWTGQWISAGAITGAHPVAPGDRFEAKFGNYAAVSCSVALASEVPAQAAIST